MLRSGKLVKSFCAILFVFCFVASFGGELLAANEKIAFVDVAKVFDGYEKTKERDKVLADEGEKKQQEREGKVQEIRRLKDELALLADQNKEEKQLAIDEKVKGLQEFDNIAGKELRDKRDAAVREILKDIDDTIKDFGTKKGYDFVFNERALVYRNEKFDVTNEVLTELNGRMKPQGKKA